MYYPLQPPVPGASAKTLPDRIVDHFTAHIFTGELAPGERLPGDRELAPLLGVDRTSLRIAMQQLARLGVIRVAHGSPARVLDFREHAGIEFLAAVFALPEILIGSGYLLQVLDDWIDLLPVITGRALARATSSEVLALDALMAAQLALLEGEHRLEELAVRELALQDSVTRMLGNTSLVLLSNSSRPLRLKLVNMFFETVDVRGHVLAQRRFLADVLGRPPITARAVTEAHRAYLLMITAPLRKRIQAMPVNPSRVERAPVATKMPAAPSAKRSPSRAARTGKAPARRAPAERTARR